MNGRRLPVKIERDGCTDFELAVGNLHTRASALALLHQLRPHFHTGALEPRRQSETRG